MRRRIETPPGAQAQADWARSSAGSVVAEHARHTPARIVLEPSHYEGESTERVLAPMPLDRMDRRLSEIWATAPERRPIDQYAAYAEVAR